MLAQAALYGNVTTRSGLQLFRLEIVTGTTRMTQIRIAFAHSQKTIAVLAVALRTTFAPTEPVHAVNATLAELFAKVLVAHALAVLVARQTRMIACIVIVH